MPSEKSALYCSFCGKSQYEVRKLIAGPTVHICDECVDLCMDIIHEPKATRHALLGAHVRENALEALGATDPAAILEGLRSDDLKSCTNAGELLGLVLDLFERAVKEHLGAEKPDSTEAGAQLASDAAPHVPLPQAETITRTEGT